jgi:HD-like signal output (HDOD) protein
MDTLKHIYLTFLQMLKQVWSLPHTIADAAQQRRQRVARNELEVERLDRIRNPSKYLGK